MRYNKQDESKMQHDYSSNDGSTGSNDSVSLFYCCIIYLVYDARCTNKMQQGILLYVCMYGYRYHTALCSRSKTKKNTNMYMSVDRHVEQGITPWIRLANQPIRVWTLIETQK